jgi:hypothetical protein
VVLFDGFCLLSGAFCFGNYEKVWVFRGLMLVFCALFSIGLSQIAFD